MGLLAGSEPLVRLLKESLPASRSLFADFFQMSVYHLVVLVWVYFAYLRERVTTPPDGNLVLQAHEELSSVQRPIDL